MLQEYDSVYGDPLIDKEDSSTRILYQNSGSIGLSNTAHTLEVICEFTHKTKADILCLAETNTHWKHTATKKKLLQVTKQFWKRSKIQTSETITPWTSINKPGGTMMLSSPKLTSRVISSGEDEEGYGRWSYTTYGGKNNTRLTIITAYRTCKPNGDIGISTVHSQQWDIMEERNIEHMNIRDKMIKDINKFLAELIFKHHEVILFIDANEPFIPGTRGIAKLTSHPQILDPLISRHDIGLEPFTYKNGSKRINFAFCTQIIDTYITRCRILPFDTISPTPHRGIYLDINILDFLKDKIHLPTTVFRILSTHQTLSVVINIT